MLALLVVFPAFLLQHMSLHSAFGIVLQNPETLAWPEWEMSSYSVVLKRASMMKKRGTLVFFTLAGSRRKHLSPLLCADKVSLFIQSRGDKHWMKQCGTEWEKERRERDGGIKGGERTRKQLGSQLPVCVSMWADGIYPCAARVLGGWPLLYSNIPPSHHYLLPPTATFLAFMFPLTLLIHSHYETACIMLFNENNPQGDGASYIQ